MKIALLVSFLALFSIAAPAHSAEPPQFKIGPVPSWVVSATVDDGGEAPRRQVSQGIHHLVVDTQITLERGERVTYRHMAIKALDDKGVEEAANVEIRFDPSYQTLVLHALGVRRNGQLVSRLDAGKVRVLQRERELEYRIFDGSKTAHVFLEDIRAGDIVEYRYSLRGSNPVFRDRYFSVFDLRWRVPVKYQRARLLWPAARPIFFTYRNGAETAQVRDLGSMREYAWSASDVQPLVLESDTPSWYDPYPGVQWSEFKDWSAVVDWALPLYALPANMPSSVADAAAGIGAATTVPAERIAKTLSFVQSEVRYLGVEIGAGSHAPNPPQVVLQRRFGDCKDKTLLAVAMLRALGIDAAPALVNTSVARGINNWQAMPLAFNHVIVRVHLDGKDLWLDPTRPAQGPVLANVVQPDYGYALPIVKGVQQLVRMTPLPTSKLHVKSTLDLSGTMTAPVAFVVTSTFEGARAENIRSEIAGANRDDLDKQYLNFYAKYYPGIRRAAAMQVQDDLAANRMTTTEHYLIDDYWKLTDDKRRHEGHLHAADVLANFSLPRDTIRSAPLGLPFPAEVEQITEAKLPGDWNIKPEKQLIEDTAFRYEHSVTKVGRLVTVGDRFVTLADHVPAADVARYVGNMKKARGATGLSLERWDSVAPVSESLVARINWPIAMLGCLLSLAAVWLAMRAYRIDPKLRPAPPADSPSGFGGWLILLLIGITFAPLRIAVDFWKTLASYAPASWAAVTTPGNEGYSELFAPLLMYELAGNLFMIAAWIFVAVLFYKRRSSLPYAYVFVAVASIVFVVSDLMLCEQLPNGAAEKSEWVSVGRSVISLAIWGTYLFVSNRARATFVETWHKPAAVQSTASPSDIPTVAP